MTNYSFQVSDKGLDEKLQALVKDPSFNFSGWIKEILRKELKV